MEKFSVKKPFTILVLVIMIITLGFVSVSRLTTDLLPEMTLPYLMVITTYPGASPDKIESTVGIPMERSLGTISGVKNIMTASNENYCMTQLAFEDGTDMDSALVKVSGAVDTVAASLPEEAGTPSILEISMDMMATMYAAVSRDGYDVYELTDYVSQEVVPYIERQDGIARVTTIGMVEKSIQVELNQDKIDKINDRILSKTNTALADARKQLDDAEEQVKDGQTALEAQEKTFGEMVSSSIFDQLSGNAATASVSLKTQMDSVEETLRQLEDAVIQAKPSVDAGLQSAEERLKNAEKGLQDAKAFFKKASDAAEQASKKADEAGDAVDSGAEKLNQTIDQLKEVEKDVEAGVKQAASDLKDTADTLPDEVSGAAQEIQDTLQDPEKAQEAIDQAAKSGQEALDQLTDPETTQKLLAQAQQQLAEAQAEYTDAKAALEEAKKTADGTLSEQSVNQISQEIQNTLASVSKAAEGTADTFSALMKQVSKISGALVKVKALLSQIEAADPAGTLSGRIAEVRYGVEMAESGIDSVPGLLAQLESGFAALTQGQLDAAVGFSTATMQLASAQAQLDAARSQYEASRDAALENANLDQLVSADTLSQLIYAQNFTMPAGYIDDAEDNAWLLKVGEQFADEKEIEDALLVDLDEVGTIRLFDVADVTVIDNAGDSYAKLNGDNAVCLCIYKSSTAGTNAVSKTAKAALGDLAENTPGLQVVSLMDQGIYIDLIVSSILSSILLGALLAIIVLILFLKDIRPTLVVGISIPLSVLFTIVLMYFSGLSLNMMTLSGLALGIGMLVDNSIVVMENIFRLRGMGLPAPRAAVQGARQVRGAIVASTLTTVCVFLPMVFTTGTVRELLISMALSIGYCLMASLAVALTVVPASASTLLRKIRPKRQPLFERLTRFYAKTLSFCLRVKVVPLALAILLLILTVWQVVRTGIVLLPEMASSDIEVDIATDSSMNRETSYQKMDEVIDTLLAVDGVDHIGAIDMASSTALVSNMTGDTSEYGSYMCYVIADDNADPDRLKELTENLKKAGESIDGCTITVSAGDMSDMTALTSSDDLTINVYGPEPEALESICSDLKELVGDVPGYTKIKDSTANGDDTLQLTIDRDKAMEYGFTTAQIYAAIASQMNTSVRSSAITVDGSELTITIVDETNLLTRENLMDMEFEETDLTAAASGGNASMGGASGSAAPAAASSGSTSGGNASSDSLSLSAGSGDSLLAGILGDTDSEDDTDDQNDPEKESEKEKKQHKLSEFATLEETTSLAQINRENMSRYLTVTANAEDGKNPALLARTLTEKLDQYRADLPHGYRVEIAGQSETINDMIRQMGKLIGLGILFIYLVMVAQFQSLLSPFIVLFTVPLAFTGGMLGLMITRQPLSMLSLMGFVILVGTVVNNGIVFVDYANQLRVGGLKRRDALIATGQTRMRPIIMTALTTILAMAKLMFGKDMGSQLGSGMAVVIAGGLLYATLMTLYIIPVLYDIFFRRPPLQVDTGDDLDDAPDDAAHYLKRTKEMHLR